MKRFSGRFLITLLLFLFMSVPAFAYEVPVGYTIVKSITSSGSEYIDTGVNVTNDTGITAYFRSARDVPITNSVLFGAQTSTSNRLRFTFSTKGFTFFHSSYSCVIEDTNYQGFKELAIDGNTCTVNNDTVIEEVGTLGDCGSLYIFALNNKGTASSFSAIELFDFCIYDGGLDGTKVRDFVPVINPSGEVGLWDKVSGQFFGNSGGESFVAGEVVEVVEPSSYEVFVSGSYASVTGAGTYDPGSLVCIDAGVRDGYKFEGWSSNTPDFAFSSNSYIDYFVMPARSVSLTANWSEITLDDSGTDPGIPDPEPDPEPDPDNPDPDNPDPDPPEITSSDVEYYSSWTDIETYQLFSTPADVFSVGLFNSSGEQGGQTFRDFGPFFWWDEDYAPETNYDNVSFIDFDIFLGGKVLMPDNYYRLRFFMVNITPDELSCRSTDGAFYGDENINFIATDLKTYYESGDSNYYYDAIVTVNSPCVITYSRYQTLNYSSLGRGLTGSISLVEPTVSGDSIGSTSGDIEDKSNQINKIEGEIFSDLELYSSQVDPGNINFGTGIVNAISFIGSTWTSAFGQLGDLQAVVTFPMFLGIALLFIGRASSVIVSGSMKSKRNNDKKGGGDVG